MHKLGLKGIRRNKRKYSSYKGTIGKIAPNLIRRDFFAPMPNMKWYTDIISMVKSFIYHLFWMVVEAI